MAEQTAPAAVERLAVVRDVVLDSSVIGTLAAATEEKQDAGLARLRVLRKKGSRLLITPTIVHEIAATYTRQHTFEKLLGMMRRTCDGFLDLDAAAVLKIEIEEANPYSTITGIKPSPLTELDGMEDAVKQDEVKKFYEQGAFGNDALRHLLEALDPIRRLVREQLESFEAYAEARRLQCLKSLLEVAHERGHIPKKDWDVDALWKKGAALRFETLTLLANEYRRLTQTQEKGEGCLTDLRILIEAAYCHEVITADTEFVGCGRLANKIARKPAVTPW